MLLGVMIRPLHGQQGVHESILAFSLRDYETAAHALRPIAEASESHDSTAQFLMAMLYASGSGVKHDAAKACSLYVSSATGSSPLNQQAENLAAELRRTELGNTSSCLHSVTHQLSEPSPTSIVLGANHHVAIDNGLTISYLGAVSNQSDFTAKLLTAAAEAIHIRNYKSAVELLTRVVQRPHERNYYAEFLLASLYTNGLGATSDQMLGCVLYTRAMDEGQGPIARAATTLVELLRRKYSTAEFDECSSRALKGFGRGFPPVVFEFDQGHWISWDGGGATINYGDLERRIEMEIFDPPAVLLTINQVEIEAQAACPRRRHLTNILKWLPGQSVREWRLMWEAYEIRGIELIRVVERETLRWVGEEPLSLGKQVEELVRLLLDDSGHLQSQWFDGTRWVSQPLECNERLHE